MTATFILSLDTEIAWGTDAHLLPRYAACFDDYPAIVRRLIDLLDTYQVPATWALVGHLLLQPDDPRALKRTPAGWYHAPYLLDWLRAARTPHEFATHTFAHIYTDVVSPAEWEADLRLCLDLHREHGLPAIRSLVFPRNQVKYLDTLTRLGIVAYRGVEGRRPREQRGVRHLLNRALAVQPPTYALTGCREPNGLVNLPASQFLLAYDGIRGFIPTASRVRQARLGLEQAVRLDEVFHLWFHPFNLGTSPRMFTALETILRQVDHLRQSGTLQALTMAQAADVAL